MIDLFGSRRRRDNYLGRRKFLKIGGTVGATVDGQARLTAANFAAKGDDRDIKWNGTSVAKPASAVRLVR